MGDLRGNLIALISLISPLASFGPGRDSEVKSDSTVGGSDTVAKVTVRGRGRGEGPGRTGGEGRSVEIMAKCGGKTDCQIRDLRFVESAVDHEQP